MTISEAVSKRILKLCKDRELSINKLANISCLTQSTVQHIVDGSSKSPEVLSIVRICDGLGITMSEFFEDKLFYNIDRED